MMTAIPLPASASNRGDGRSRSVRPTSNGRGDEGSAGPRPVQPDSSAVASSGVIGSRVRTWSAIDPLPYVDLRGFDWFYSRIWRVYREVDDPRDDRRAWELLWGVAAGSRDPGGSRFSVLGGLVGRERRRGADGESDTRWRLLYIPF